MGMKCQDISMKERSEVPTGHEKKSRIFFSNPKKERVRMPNDCNERYLSKKTYLNHIEWVYMKNPDFKKVSR